MDLQAFIRKHNQFNVSFSKQILESNMDNNTVFSPITISLAMSLAGAGAKGQALDQIMSTCFNMDSANSSPDQMHQFSSQLLNCILADASSSGGPILSFANGVWVESSIKLNPNFIQVVKKHYNTEANSLDFINKPNEVVSKVNQWASKETKGKVEELLPDGSIDGNSRLVLANALYFLGEWQKKFDPCRTKDDRFHLMNGNVVQVPMMTTRKKQSIKRIDDCKILHLPYAKGQDNRSFSMYIILPDKLDGLPELEEKIHVDFIERYLRKGDEVSTLSFQLPKFKVLFAMQARDTLMNLGLETPFTEESDFSEMVEDPGVAKQLYISDLFHKAFIEVNEKGTEAAAATASILATKSFQLPTNMEDFVADHPFMFVIKEDVTGVILFVGHVMNPVAD